MNLLDVLSKRKNELTGRQITLEESEELTQAFPEIPDWAIAILLDYPITECDFDLSEEFDESGFGVSLRWMLPAQSISEATECYPGIAAITLGYIPFCICLEGSGDYYYIQFENTDPPLVRIPHPATDRDGQLVEQDIELVSSSLSKFFAIAEF